nr:MAG TPA: hypothetical protein [Crassvirales sp.]
MKKITDKIYYYILILLSIIYIYYKRLYKRR